MNLKEYGLIAVVGVSEDPSKYGHRIFHDLAEAGYPVEGVNPRGGTVLGRRLHASLSGMAAKPDLVITVVPPAMTESTVEECGRLGIKAVWMQPGSESPAALAKAGEYGIKAVTACFMVQKGVW